MLWAVIHRSFASEVPCSSTLAHELRMLLAVTSINGLRMLLAFRHCYSLRVLHHHMVLLMQGGRAK